MKRFEIAMGLALVLALGSGPARAEEDGGERRPVTVKVKVTHLSDGDGGVDPNAQELIKQLESQHIRFRSAQVVQELEVELEPGDVGTVQLGDGRKAQVQLMHVDEGGALLGIDIEDGARADARVGDGKQLVIDGGNVGDGKRVITFEPEID